MAINYFGNGFWFGSIGSIRVSSRIWWSQYHLKGCRSTQEVNTGTTIRPTSQGYDDKQTRPRRVGRQEQSSHGFNSNSNSFSITILWTKTRHILYGYIISRQKQQFSTKDGDIWKKKNKKKKTVKRSNQIDYCINPINDKIHGLGWVLILSTTRTMTRTNIRYDLMTNNCFISKGDYLLISKGAKTRKRHICRHSSNNIIIFYKK